MKRLFVITAAALAFASVAHAEEGGRRFEVAPFVGAYLPTGDQRDMLKDGALVGVAGSYELHRFLSVVGSFAWAPTEVKGLASDNKLDLFQYDLGVEGRYPLALAAGWTVQPFVGAGAGARTYSLRDLDVDAETDFAGYVAAGVAAQRGPLSLRVSARDYVTPFDGLDGEGESTTRNDVGIFAGVGVRF